MPTTVVVGAQWGDEGKGKIIDYLAAKFRVIVRYGGGPNAGHTLVVNGQKIILHLLPSAIAYEDKFIVVGPGVVCDPQILMEEIELAGKFGSRIALDPGAHIILPLHRQLDEVREAGSGKAAIGTTKRGMGPIHEDIAARRGLTLGQLTLNEDDLRDALIARGFYHERATLIKSYGATPMSLDDLIFWCAGFHSLTEHLGDTRSFVQRCLKDGWDVLAEGAQGVVLDPYHGTRPYSTPSICTPAGFSASMGVYDFTDVIGVTKAYVTRVGGGPFPTEALDMTGDLIRERGHEYGSTTGRPRRVGCLDIPALRHACRMGGIRKLVMTKLDILTGLDQIKVCTAYKVNGELVPEDKTLTTDLLTRAEPYYLSARGWKEPIDKCRSMDGLPEAARSYIENIESAVGVPIVGVGVGPERDAIIWR